MNCDGAREALEARRRGELPAGEARALDAHLAGCPRCQAGAAEDDALARLIGTLPRTPAPQALRRRVRALGIRRTGPRAWLARPWVAAALAAALVAAVLAPWVRFSAEPPPTVLEALIQSGVAEHRRILLQLEVGPGGVDDPAALFDRVGTVTDVPVPKAFAGSGDLRLVTARPTLLLSRKGAAAALQYRTSPVTTYFVLPGKDLPMPTEGRVQIDQYRPYMREVSGFNVVYWKQGELAYLMVSGLDREGCQKLFLKMRRAL
ncbi:MAG TPA: zf-HC2 domain-containing protein [Methylomirabilota bacterium]|jgi:anti-sigma factor RsiW|nr:zf-HC2 domain-containing protein [Methylomirabilota bacterium]